MVKKIFIISFLLLTISIGCKQENATENKLQTLLDNTLKQYPDAVGIMLSIEAPDKNFSWDGVTGYSNKETKEPVQKDQPGMIASITKTFLAVTIFRLIEEGKLSLNQSISEVMPERTRLLMERTGYQPDSITIGHLLSHKAGMPGIETPKWKKKEREDQKYRWTRDEQLQDAFNMNEKGAIGYEWSYSDVNYLLLSEIVEEITGTSFYLAIRDLIRMDELGLDHTWFYTLEQNPKNIKKLVHQYKESRNWVSSYDDSPTFGLYGPSGIVSTTGNLARFSKYLFEGKIYKNENTLDLMLTDMPTKNGKEIEYVHHDSIQMNSFMGIEEYSTTGIHAYGHFGYWGSWMAYFPDENVHIGLFVLNADEMDEFEMKMMRSVLDILKVELRNDLQKPTNKL